MTQDNAYSFAQFAVIGGLRYEGQVWQSMRLFSDYESALSYAYDILATFDYAYISGVNADGTVDLEQSVRVDGEGAEASDLAW